VRSWLENGPKACAALGNLILKDKDIHAYILMGH
jgi:hypothetical protein